ncbi:hypothetical protein KAR91_00790 [Candidatus Pacearchaeota archaeon]|nr:hypothetical protein [Candidatus Pacearchaeota archaeon]
MTVWVSMTDRFMSGWGHAEGKINKLVISCDTYSEAVIVAENARSRSEMKYVNIRLTKPYYPEHSYLVSRHGRDEGTYENWFKTGYFK